MRGHHSSYWIGPVRQLSYLQLYLVNSIAAHLVPTFHSDSPTQTIKNLELLNYKKALGWEQLTTCVKWQSMFFLTRHTPNLTLCVCVWGLRNHKEITKIRVVMVLVNCSHRQRSSSFTGAKLHILFQYSMAYVSLP